MIVFAYPKSFAQFADAGAWKDITAITDMLEAQASYEFKAIGFDDHDSTLGEAALIASVDERVTQLVIYYSRWPKACVELKQRFPQLVIHTRLVNAEACHFLERYPQSIFQPKAWLRRWYGFFRLLHRDWKTLQVSDYLWGINAVEGQHYWRRLGVVKVMASLSAANQAALPKKTYVYVPYYSTLTPSPMAWSERDNVILTMPGARDPVSVSMLDELQCLARRIRYGNDSATEAWSCSYTRGVLHRDVSEADAYADMNVVDVNNVSEQLHLVKAIAVLGTKGYGFKTTILDALHCGCHVLLSPVMAQRMPEDIVEQCLVVDVQDSDSVQQMLQALQQPPVDVQINRVTKASATQTVQALLALGDGQASQCLLGE